MMRFLMIKYAVSFLLMSMALPVYGQYVDRIFEKVRKHDFNPLMQDNSMTFDKDLKTAGIADLNDEDWKVRMIAVRDLVHEGSKSINEIIPGLNDPSIHVRQVTACALGIISAKVAIEPLEQVLLTDENAMVRAQAVISLGQIESGHSLDILRKKLQEDPSRDVRHQCELAIDQIEKKKGTTAKLQKAFLSIDDSTFETVDENTMAPDFILEDTEGIEWQLSEFRNKKWVVLIWVFADWCPVCHGEFHDLMKMQDQFEEADIQIFTLETHDTYRGRVMVGKELEPEYWFTKESFREAYTNNIWWPHLLDRGGILAAAYGADPFAFVVHSEYINRPTTAIIDKQGVVKFIYRGTFWGDRPTIEETLKIIETENFSFEHPQRLKK
ncbi:MAG: HEAT repeat domain-containing protein [Bacteroidota bacterium]